MRVDQPQLVQENLMQPRVGDLSMIRHVLLLTIQTGLCTPARRASEGPGVTASACQSISTVTSKVAFPRSRVGLLSEYFEAARNDLRRPENKTQRISVPDPGSNHSWLSHCCACARSRCASGRTRPSRTINNAALASLCSASARASSRPATSLSLNRRGVAPHVRHSG